MNKNNDLNQIFEQYAETFEEQQGVTQKARLQMQKTRNKRKGFLRWASVLCCVVVFCVVLIAVYPTLFNSNNSRPSEDNSPPPVADGNPTPEYPSESRPQVVSYKKGQVLGKQCSPQSVPNVNLSAVVQSYNVVSSGYYAFYLDGTNTIAYYKIVLGILQEDGITELTLIAERDGYLREDLKQDYESNMSATLKVINGVTEHGEYVTNAYLQAQGVHFYLEITGNTANSNEIANLILQQ